MDLPSANVSIDDAAGGFAGVSENIVVLAAVAQNADAVPRFYASVSGVLAQHGYSQGADYLAHHVEATRKPAIFVGLPIATAGVLRRLDNSGVGGTSAISIAAAASGYLDEVEGSLVVAKGGTIGTDQILFDLSLDGGRSTKRVRLSTATSYTVPYLGIVISFGAGTLLSGDTVTWSISAPLWDADGVAAALAGLRAQVRQCRTWIVAGDVPNSTMANVIVSAANAYATATNRYTLARVSIRDQCLARSSKVVHPAAQSSLTFSSVDHTVTRSSGSWVTDGFVVGTPVTFVGTAHNDGTYVPTGVTATVLTFASGLTAETVSTASVGSAPGVTFAASGHTATRTAGSWLDEGFAVGDSVTISGTTSNNATLVIGALTATTMTFSFGVANEGPLSLVTVSFAKAETRAAYVSTADSAFASISGERRIDLSLGRARVLSRIHGWNLRRPAAWAASVREYQHDVQIPCWRKSDGPLLGWDITNGAGRVVEFDERVDGGALAARFTCLRTWTNDNGTFVALSVTRADEASILSRTHNMAVANVASTIVQAESENAVGRVLVLKDNGVATEASIRKLEEAINTKLQIYLLSAGREGPRASKAVWQAARDDVLNVPAPELNGVLYLMLNGTLERINTTVRVLTAGG